MGVLFCAPAPAVRIRALLPQPAMGRITNFHGQMQTQISFCVEGREHRASMVKEKSRDVAGAEDAEKITIRLEADGKSICVESLETGQGKSIRSVSSDVPEMLIILFGVSWMSDTASALQDADHDKKVEERLLSENQTLDEFFLNIYNFLNGDM